MAILSCTVVVVVVNVNNESIFTVVVLEYDDNN
mgnify:FL=1